MVLKNDVVFACMDKFGNGSFSINCIIKDLDSCQSMELFCHGYLSDRTSYIFKQQCVIIYNRE